MRRPARAARAAGAVYRFFFALAALSSNLPAQRATRAMDAPFNR